MNDSNQKEHTCKKSTYLLLLIFLGFTGAHKFYSKNYKKAWLMLLLFLYEIILILQREKLSPFQDFVSGGPVLLTILYAYDLIKAFIFTPLENLLLSMVNSNDKENEYKKNKYLSLLFCGGITGIHLFYSKDIKRARCYLGIFLFALIMIIVNLILNYNNLYLSKLICPDSFTYFVDGVRYYSDSCSLILHILAGPFGIMLAILTLFILICLCISDFLLVYFQISNKDGLITKKEHKERTFKQSTYLLLLIFLGFTGAHKFYSKNYGKALFMFFLFFVATLGCLGKGVMGLGPLIYLVPIYLFDLIKALIFEPIVKLLSGILSINNCEHKFKKFDYIFYLIFGGIIGLHHFYSKNIKKARTYLGWFMFAICVFFIRNVAKLYFNNPLNCAQMDFDCRSLRHALGVLAAAFGGPLGALIIVMTIFIILCFCLVDLIKVIFKKSDKDGYITSTSIKNSCVPMTNDSDNQRKCKKLNYLLLLIFGGVIGLHHLYSKNIKKARIYRGIIVYAILVMISVHLAREFYITNVQNLTHDDIEATICHGNESKRNCYARVRLLAALSGPFGDLLYMIPIFIILCCCFVDFKKVISKKSDKDGYITF